MMSIFFLCAPQPPAHPPISQSFFVPSRNGVTIDTLYFCYLHCVQCLLTIIFRNLYLKNEKKKQKIKTITTGKRRLKTRLSPRFTNFTLLFNRKSSSAKNDRHLLTTLQQCNVPFFCLFNYLFILRR